jgi:hypothetical protein
MDDEGILSQRWTTMTDDDIAKCIRILLKRLITTKVDKEVGYEARDARRVQFAGFWLNCFAGLPAPEVDEHLEDGNVNHPLHEKWTDTLGDDDDGKIDVINVNCPPRQYITLDRLLFLIFYIRWNASPKKEVAKEKRRSVVGKIGKTSAIRKETLRDGIKELIKDCKCHIAEPSPLLWGAMRKDAGYVGVLNDPNLCDSNGVPVKAPASSNRFAAQMNEIWNTILLSDIVSSPTPPKHISRPSPSSSTTVITPFRTADSLVGMYTPSSTMFDFAKDIIRNYTDPVIRTEDSLGQYTQLDTVTHTIASRVLINQNRSTGSLYISYVHPCISAEYIILHMLRHCDTYAAYYKDVFKSLFENFSSDVAPPLGRITNERGKVFDMGQIKKAWTAADIDLTAAIEDLGHPPDEDAVLAAKYRILNGPEQDLEDAESVIGGINTIVSNFGAILKDFRDTASSHNSMTRNAWVEGSYTNTKLVLLLLLIRHKMHL